MRYLVRGKSFAVVFCIVVAAVAMTASEAWAPPPECTVDADCDDGLFCNGAETCNAGTCQQGSDPCPGEQCDEVNDICQPIGGCCFSDGSCLDVTGADCVAQGGDYQGDQAFCADVNCPLPVGACCDPANGQCYDSVTEAECLGQQGVYQGDGTVCSGIECPQPGDITAHKFNDLNGNGVQDAGEEDLSGWQMDLYDADNCSGSLIASGITDEAGNVTFSGLSPGDYSVRETLQVGWQNTTDLCQNVTLAAGGSEIITIGNQLLPLGACCETNGVDPANAVTQVNGIHCRETIESDCLGPWNPTVDCVEDACDPTPGACFAKDGTCEEVARIDCFDTWRGGECPAKPVPTVTQWGLIIMSILLIGSAAWFIRRRKRTS